MEARERRELVERVELREYLIEASTGREAVGAARELRSAVFGDKARPFLVPWEILDPGPEVRADAATAAPATTGSSQATVLGRVFSAGIASYLGVDLPSVPSGDANFPVLSAGVSPSIVAKGTVKDAEAGTIVGTTLEPRRLTARYLFSVEDAARLHGLEEALRADLSGALSSAMDAQILNGNGTAPNVDGFLNEITAPAIPTALADAGIFVSTSAAAVDGRYARNLMGVRALVGSATYGLAAAAVAANGTIYVADYLVERSAGFIVSDHVPVAPTSGNLDKVQEALLYRAAFGGGVGYSACVERLRACS